MEKIKLNNQVVYMRKIVKKVKFHIIKKLNKEVELLQIHKGNEVKIKKAQRKADRYLEKIAILKKIKPDDLSKLALSKAKDWKTVLQQRNSTLHDHCIALLASHKTIQKEVESFHNSHKEVVSQITDLIKHWEEKNKFKNSLKTKTIFDEKKTDKGIQKATLKNENSPCDIKNNSDIFVKVKNQLSSKDDTFQISTDISKKCEKGKSKCSVQQKKIPDVKPVENTLFNKLSEQESCSDDNEDVEDAPEINMSDNDEKFEENFLAVNNSYNDADSEDKTMMIKNLKSAKDIANIIKCHRLHSDENKMETENSDSDEDELIDDDCKDNDYIIKNKKIPDVKPVENTLCNKLSEQESCSDDNEDVEDAPEINKSDNDEKFEENLLAVNNSYNNADSEDKTMMIKDLKSDKDNANIIKCHRLHSDENKMETENSDSDEDELIDDDCKDNDYIIKNKTEAKNYRYDEDIDSYKLQQSDIPKFTKKEVKIKSNTEKNLKEIALVNLDKLQGLDEIPVYHATENDKSAEETSEEESDDDIGNNRNDPFFIRCDDDKTVEKLVGSPKINNFISRNKNSVLPNTVKTEQKKMLSFNLTESNSFKRQQNSNQFSPNKFEKFHTSRRNSTRFKNDRNNVKSFEKNKFLSRNYQDKFQEKCKSTFGKDSFKTQQDFIKKQKMQPSMGSYSRKKNEDNSNNIYHQKGDNNFSVKSRVLHKKDNASDKPLHPSWAAKKKQQELINTSFQGKRIVFDN